MFGISLAPDMASADLPDSLLLTIATASPDGLLFSFCTSEPRIAGFSLALEGASALPGLMSLAFSMLSKSPDFFLAP